jgi:hypothetical protein
MHATFHLVSHCSLDRGPAKAVYVWFMLVAPWTPSTLREFISCMRTYGLLSRSVSEMIMYVSTRGAGYVIW